jgi:hypothetical protein
MFEFLTIYLSNKKQKIVGKLWKGTVRKCLFNFHILPPNLRQQTGRKSAHSLESRTEMRVGVESYITKKVEDFIFFKPLQ